jgi:hypothetical protein
MSTEQERELRELLDACGLVERHVDFDSEQIAIVQASSQRAVDRILAGHTTPRKKRTFRGLATGAVVAALAAAVFVVASPGGGPQVALAGFQKPTAFDGLAPGYLPSDGEPANALLEQLAKKADAQHESGDGDIHYVRTVAWSGAHGEQAGTSTALSLYWSVNRSSYLLPEGRMRAIEERGPAYTPYGELAKDLGPFEGAPSVIDESFDTDSLTRSNPESFSLDPDDLLARAQDRCIDAQLVCLDHLLSGLFTSIVVPPKLQAASLRALAKVDGVVSLGQVEDRLGRTVEVFEFEGVSDRFRKIVFFSPDTGLYLGHEDIMVEVPPDMDVPVPSLWYTSLLLESRMVNRDDLPEVPRDHKYYDRNPKTKVAKLIDTPPDFGK